MWRNNTMRTTVATMPKYANVSGAPESGGFQNRNTTRTQCAEQPSGADGPQRRLCGYPSVRSVDRRSPEAFGEQPTRLRI